MIFYRETTSSTYWMTPYMTYIQNALLKVGLDLLQKKYKTEDAGAKNLIVRKILKCEMVDIRYVINQVENLLVLIHKLHNEGCSINEHIQVGVIVEKLSPS